MLANGLHAAAPLYRSFSTTVISGPALKVCSGTSHLRVIKHVLYMFSQQRNTQLHINFAIERPAEAPNAMTEKHTQPKFPAVAQATQQTLYKQQSIKLSTTLQLRHRLQQ